MVSHSPLESGCKMHFPDEQLGLARVAFLRQHIWIFILEQVKKEKKRKELTLHSENVEWFGGLEGKKGREKRQGK